MWDYATTIAFILDFSTVEEREADKIALVMRISFYFSQSFYKKRD